MSGRRIVAVGALSAVVIAGSVVVAAEGSAEPVGQQPAVVLPAPSGPHDVGTTTLHLEDAERADPWVPDRRRELMVTVTYPARAVQNLPLAHYVSNEAVPVVVGDVAAALNLPIESQNLIGLRTAAHAGAPVVDTPDRSLPVVLYSPGMLVPRLLGTGAAEDLASRGYVVVSIDHTYEAQAVEFPGGRVVVGIDQTDDPERSRQWRRTALDARVADTIFVLDELTELADGGNPDVERRPLPDGLGRALDPSRIGMFGHSLGGFTAAEAMVHDDRIDAGVNLDGMIGLDELGAAAVEGLDRPLLLMSSEQVSAAGGSRPSWDAFWDSTRGWKRELELAGAAHYSFTDLSTLVPPAARAAVPELTEYFVGTIAPDRATRAVWAYVAAMFDRFLRGLPTQVLDAPAAEFPDVRFVR